MFEKKKIQIVGILIVNGLRGPPWYRTYWKIHIIETTITIY